MLHLIKVPVCHNQLMELTTLARLTLMFGVQYDVASINARVEPDPPYSHRKVVAKRLQVLQQTDPPQIRSEFVADEAFVNRVWGAYLAFMASYQKRAAATWLFDQWSVVTLPALQLVSIPLVQKSQPDIAQLFAADVALLEQLATTQDDLSAYPQFYYQQVRAKIDRQVDTLVCYLMRKFYEALFRNKERPIPSEVVGGHIGLNRNELMRGFAYLNVCPGCDGPQPSIRDKVLQTQTDHFFPLSIYPFFAVHPLNLVPYCIECNSPMVKGDRDVLQVANAQHIQDIFHPYRPARDYLQVVLNYNAQAQPELTITESGQDTPRMRSIITLLNLKNRWEGEFHQLQDGDQQHPSRVLGRVFSKLEHRADAARHVCEEVGRTFHLNLNWLVSNLQKLIVRTQAEIGQMPRAITDKAYLEWVWGTPQAQNNLLNNFQLYLSGRDNIEARFVPQAQAVVTEGSQALGIV